MIFQPASLKTLPGVFRLPAALEARGNACLNVPVLREFYASFSNGLSALTVTPEPGFCLKAGDADALPVGESEYTLRVTTGGFCLSARSEQGLRHGFMTLLDTIECDAQGAFLPCCEIGDKPRLDRIMAHYCVFPETKLFSLRRMIRLCAFLRQTHLIVEFWGMYRYSFEPMLSWKEAFTADELAPLISEARDLGLELVPMLNHLGHASQSRLCYRKHVTLDRDPSKWRWFEKDGWAWNLAEAEVQTLLSRARDELCELFPGAYFHIGCDEAYSFTAAPEKAPLLCSHVNRAVEDLARKGRKTLMWADMLLPHDPFPGDPNTYEFNIENGELARTIRDNLDRRVILADWQYHAKKVPVRSALQFVQEGFDTMLCPFLEKENARACVDTAEEYHLGGVIHTTWHLLETDQFPVFVFGALLSLQKATDEAYSVLATHSAYLLRHLLPAGGDYGRAGWREGQL